MPSWSSNKWIALSATTTIIVGLIVGLSVGLASLSSSSPHQQEADPCHVGELGVLLQCECFDEIQPTAESMLQESYAMLRKTLQGRSNHSEFSGADNSTSYSCSAENLALCWVANDTIVRPVPQQQDLDVGFLSQRYTLATL